jgi:phage virion morphogenesis protein
MPDGFIKIEVDNRRIKAALKRLADAGKDLEPALRDIGEYMINATKERFARSEAPDGTSWEPNMPSTLSRKKGDKPLIGESKRLSSEISYALAGDEVEIGSSLEYAAVQQFGADKGEFGYTSRGAPIPWGDIPARPFLGISDADEQEILAIIGDHIMKSVE